MKIEGEIIYYKIRQQNDTFVEMTVANNGGMRKFVKWLEAYESSDFYERETKADEKKTVATAC